MSTLWGIGTKLYGKADRKPIPGYGETYVTTEWSCIVYLPIIPISSMRIGGVQQNSLILVVYNSTTTKYYILEKLPLQWKQILRTYALGWGFVLLLFMWPVIAAFLDKIHKYGKTFSWLLKTATG